MVTISIITVTFNSIESVSDTIDSVTHQSYPWIEYIIIDGASTDGTIDVIKSYGDKISKFISEPDQGIYDAINKGIRLASGDIIGILNSDDHFTQNDVLEKIAAEFKDPNCQAVIADARFIDPANLSKIVRYYSSENFRPEKFKYGFMPAHPGFYARRELFEKFGYYKTDYKIAADYELLIRFLYVHKVKFRYLKVPVVDMRTGGVSNKTLYSRYLLNKEIVRACRENGIKTNYLLIYPKYFIKIFEFMGLNKSRHKSESH